MTTVLNGKGLLLEGSNPKIEHKKFPQEYILCDMLRLSYASVVLSSESSQFGIDTVYRCCRYSNPCNMFTKRGFNWKN